MKKIFFAGLALLLVFSFGCAKKKTGGGKGGEGGTAAVGDVKKFDEGSQRFREAIRFISVKPDKAKAAEAAGLAETAFGEVAKAWPKDPPDAFAGDTTWATDIGTLKKLMGDVKTQVEGDKTADAQASILEAQKIILGIHDKNKINTAGDEAVRLLVIAHDMDVAFREKRFNDMKHIMPNMREAQKNFFGSTAPASARGREDTFDTMKDNVYEGVETFAIAPNPEERRVALDNLIKATTEFYVEFG